MRARMASAAVWMISPASGVTACTPMSRPLPASATSLMKPRVSKLASARGTLSNVRSRLSAGLRFGQPDRGDLRVAEHHRRHRGQVQGSLATGHVDGRPRSGRRRDIDELWLVRAVAGGIDAGRAGAHGRVDDDAALRVDGDAGRLQRERLGVGRSARRDEQLVHAQLALAGGEHELAVGVGDLAGLGVLQHLDALGAESGGDRLADGRVLSEEQGAARQDRDLAAEPGEGLGQFDGDDRRADHRQARRDHLGLKGFLRGPVRRALQAGNGRYGRAGTRGDQAAVEDHVMLGAVGLAHEEAMAVPEAGLAAQHGD